MKKKNNKASEVPLYLFHQGANACAYEFFGAHREGDRVVFRVWAPGAKEVAVVGDFNGWDHTAAPMTRLPDGTWEVYLEHVNEYDAYKYRILGADGKEQADFSPWDPFTIHINYTAQKQLDDAVIGLAIYRSDGALIYGTNTLIDTSEPVTLHPEGIIDLKVDGLPAANGDYTIDLALHKPDGFNYDFWRDICTIHIADKIQTPGEIALSHQWDVK